MQCILYEMLWTCFNRGMKVRLLSPKCTSTRSKAFMHWRSAFNSKRWKDALLEPNKWIVKAFLNVLMWKRVRNLFQNFCLPLPLSPHWAFKDSIWALFRIDEDSLKTSSVEGWMRLTPTDIREGVDLRNQKIPKLTFLQRYQQNDLLEISQQVSI